MSLLGCAPYPCSGFRGAYCGAPSDHLILKEDVFRQTLEDGFDFVEKGDRLLTLGLNPTAPATGYGYIQRGVAVENFPGICKVKSFTEKPNLEMAKVFISTGEFFWNAGIFLWRADSILRAFDRYDRGDRSGIRCRSWGIRYAGEMNFINTSFPNTPRFP